MKLRQALGFFVQFTPYPGGQLAERGQLNSVLFEAPGAGDLTVEKERVDRVRGADVEDLLAVLLGQDSGPAGVDQQRGVPDGEEARRHRRLGVGERGAGE